MKSKPLQSDLSREISGERRIWILSVYCNQRQTETPSLRGKLFIYFSEHQVNPAVGSIGKLIVYSSASRVLVLLRQCLSSYFPQALVYSSIADYLVSACLRHLQCTDC